MGAVEALVFPSREGERKGGEGHLLSPLGGRLGRE